MPKNIQLIQSLPGYRVMEDKEIISKELGDKVFNTKKGVWGWHDSILPAKSNYRVKLAKGYMDKAYARKIKLDE